MAKKSPRTPLGVAPPQHVPGRPPKGGRAPAPPERGRVALPPSLPAPTRVPEQHGVGAVPNPVRPKLVRDVHGGALQDLFEIFPDLPRPTRPKGRAPVQRRRVLR